MECKQLQSVLGDANVAPKNHQYLQTYKLSFHFNATIRYKVWVWKQDEPNELEFDEMWIRVRYALYCRQDYVIFVNWRILRASKKKTECTKLNRDDNESCARKFWTTKNHKSS
jgi:hypothetical protein